MSHPLRARLAAATGRGDDRRRQPRPDRLPGHRRAGLDGDAASAVGLRYAAGRVRLPLRAVRTSPPLAQGRRLARGGPEPSPATGDRRRSRGVTALGRTGHAPDAPLDRPEELGDATVILRRLLQIHAVPGARLDPETSARQGALEEDVDLNDWVILVAHGEQNRRLQGPEPLLEVIERGPLALEVLHRQG